MLNVPNLSDEYIGSTRTTVTIILKDDCCRAHEIFRQANRCLSRQITTDSVAVNDFPSRMICDSRSEESVILMHTSQRT